MKVPIGQVERVFAVLLLAYIASTYIPALSGLQLLLKAAAVVLGGWVFLRLARGLVVRLLWRLRNRLVVAYIFIALVPVVLITLLIGLGINLVGGQFTIYLLTSELERKNAALQAGLNTLLRRGVTTTEWASNLAPVLAASNPALRISMQDESGGTWTWPRDTSGVSLPDNWKPGSGLVLLDDQLYTWALVQNGRRKASALVPVTR